MSDEATYEHIFDLHHLLAVPMTATVDADFYAATRFLRFVREYGFEQSDTEDSWGKLKTIAFSYQTLEQAGQWVQHRVEIPVLSLMPLPLLQVDRAEFDMDVRVLGELSAGEVFDKNGGGKGELAAATVPRHPKAVLQPCLPKDSGTRTAQLAANLKVHLSVKQADLPAGMIKLLTVAQEAHMGQVGK